MSLFKCYFFLLDLMNVEICICWLQIVVCNDYYFDFYRVWCFLESQMLCMYIILLYEDFCIGVFKFFVLEVFYQMQGWLYFNLCRVIQQILFQGLGFSIEFVLEFSMELGRVEVDIDLDVQVLLFGDEVFSSVIFFRDVNVFVQFCWQVDF